MLYHQQLGPSGPVVIGLHGLATANRLLSLRLTGLADEARLFCRQPRPNVRLQVLPGVDHDAIVTRTGVVVDATRDLIRRGKQPRPAAASRSRKLATRADTNEDEG